MAYNQKDALNKLKIEAATELGMLQNIKENNDHYLGNATCRENGLSGGPIGGRMVKKMIDYAKNNL